MDRASNVFCPSSIFKLNCNKKIDGIFFLPGFVDSVLLVAVHFFYSFSRLFFNQHNYAKVLIDEQIEMTPNFVFSLLCESVLKEFLATFFFVRSAFGGLFQFTLIN